MDALIIIMIPVSWVFASLSFRDMDPQMIDSFIAFYGRG